MVSVIHVLRGGMVHGVLSRHTRRGPFNDGVGATSKDPWQRLNICEASSRLASSVFHVCIYIYVYVLFDTNRWMNNDKEWQIDVTTDRKRVGDLFRRKNLTCANILSCGQASFTKEEERH